ncbi:hypothetical protein J6590_024141 [Homalodisca vitripennis]|nr:hypothetical protein J6590_024141 [Homalodisca vitripennis]
MLSKLPLDRSAQSSMPLHQLQQMAVQICIVVLLPASHFRHPQLALHCARSWNMCQVSRFMTPSCPDCILPTPCFGRIKETKGLKAMECVSPETKDDHIVNIIWMEL